MTFYDLIDRIDSQYAIPATTDRGWQSGIWAAPGLTRLRTLLVFSVIWLFLSSLAGTTAFIQALATCLAICSSLVYLARSGDLLRWIHIIAWGMRAGAVITACWLAASIPSTSERLLAVALFAAVYPVCERSVWRRVRNSEPRAA